MGFKPPTGFACLDKNTVKEQNQGLKPNSIWAVNGPTKVVP
jgi:hypothetical protein